MKSFYALLAACFVLGVAFVEWVLRDLARGWDR